MTSSSPTSELPLEQLHGVIKKKLSSHNFLLWKSQFTPYLQAYDLEKFIDGTCKSPPAIANGTPNPLFLSWRCTDKLLLWWIRSSLTSPVLAKVKGCETSHSIWTKLGDLFASKNQIIASQPQVNISQYRCVNEPRVTASRGRNKRKRAKGNNNMYLTEDIIIEILSRLPLRFLLQYRCVCKRWSILSDTNPKLIQMRKNSFNIMLIDGERKIHSLDNDLLSSSLSDGIKNHVKTIRCPITSLHSDLEKVNFVGSCNGLFFLYQGDIDHFCSWNPYLWNPFTQEFKYLKRPGFPVNETYCILHRGHGFGYDAKNDDYKCVRIFIYSAGTCGNSEVHIYSLRSNKWKLRHIPYVLSTEDAYFRAPNGVFCNGALHWFANSPEVIMALNMTDERIRELPKPESVNESGYRRHVAVLDGDLCILCLNFAAYEIWLMKDYGIRESWTRAYKIPSLTLELGGLKFVDLKKMEYLKTGEILFEVQYNYYKNAAVVLYDPKNERATYLKLYGDFGDCSIIRSVMYRYVKSTVQLNYGYQVGDKERKDGQKSIIHIRD